VAALQQFGGSGGIRIPAAQQFGGSVTTLAKTKNKAISVTDREGL
jgi:hypothetical protein